MVLWFTKRAVYFLPIIQLLWTTSTLLLCYYLAVKADHVLLIFPYISDVSGLQPESSYFSFFGTIGNFFALMCLYARFRQVSTWLRSSTIFPSRDMHLVAYNWVSLLTGLGAAMGFMVLSSFSGQGSSFVHFMGAIGFFVCGTIAFWTHTIITRKLRDYSLETTQMYYLRFILASGCTKCYVLAAIFSRRAVGKFTDDGDDYKWYPDQPGYRDHLFSTLGEWGAVLFYMLFLLTFANGFRSMRFQHPFVMDPIHALYLQRNHPPNKSVTN